MKLLSRQIWSLAWFASSCHPCLSELVPYQDRNVLCIACWCDPQQCRWQGVSSSAAAGLWLRLSVSKSKAQIFLLECSEDWICRNWFLPLLLQNHRIVWVEVTFKVHLVQPPCNEQKYLQLDPSNDVLIHKINYFSQISWICCMWKIKLGYFN